HPLTKRRAYACQECGHHIYPAAGTIFHKSSTPLTKWFFAMYLMTSTRHGVAAKELERQLGVTYKTAWRMAHELRKLMASADHDFGGGPTLKGHVEIDETFVGGKRKRNEPDNKIVVMGMLQRDGKIVAGPVPDATTYTLEGVINENVVPGSTISTDTHRAYHGLRHAYQHGTVNHSAKEYVRGEHHVNSLESHWSLFKRAVKGTHVHISAKHSWKYISEFSYRRNMRHSHWSMFNLLVHAFALPRIQDA
ncbi:MAG: IS1595 family transposase, partial [Pseudorhodoplanes sp.]|nr:IS1595 family transposase [Pseudorhodoplanes sp.]